MGEPLLFLLVAALATLVGIARANASLAGVPLLALGLLLNLVVVLANVGMPVSAATLELVLRCATGSSLSRVRTPTGEPSRRTCGGDGSVGHPAGSSANRAIIRTGPSAHHSPVGRFQLRSSK